MTIGKPHYMDINKILDAAEEFMMADDGQKGLWLLDNLPSYYMDNYPMRAYEIKRSYYKRLYSLEDYLNSEFDNTWDEERAIKHYQHESQWRREFIKDIIKPYNEANMSVHIHELGAANFWLPLGLKSEGFKFTYKSIGPDVMANRQAKEKLKDIWEDVPHGPTIFVCMEVIEHCMNPQDVYHYYCKLPREAEYLVLSTPRYMIGGSMNGVCDWRNKDQGHVKTWGAQEFLTWANSNFRLHENKILDHQHLIIRSHLKSLVTAETKIDTVDGVKK